MCKTSLDRIIYNGLSGGDIRNLYSEVETILRRNNRNFSDIDWVECVEHKDLLDTKRYEIPLDNFISAAKSTDYDAEMWRRQIPMSFRIYGKDRSFMIRVCEYDGKQWLEYIDMMVERPTNSKYVCSFNLDEKYMENPKWVEDSENYTDEDDDDFHKECEDGLMNAMEMISGQ